MNLKQALVKIKNEIHTLTIEALKAWCENNGVDVNNIGENDLARIKADFSTGLSAKSTHTGLAKPTAVNTAQSIDAKITAQHEELTQAVTFYVEGKSTQIATELREITSELAPRTLEKLSHMLAEDANSPDLFRSEARTALEQFGFTL